MRIVLTSDLHYGFSGKTHNKIHKTFKKINQLKPDLLIIAGDIPANCQHQFKRCLEEANDIVKCDIAFVRGNHCLWDALHKKDDRSTLRSLNEIYQHHQQIALRLGLHILTSKPLKYGDIEIFGFDGWYAQVPQTNDAANMPFDHEGCPIMPFLINKAWKDFDKCLESAKKSQAKTKILVTHHNLYEEPKYPGSKHGGILRFYPEVKENFDILCCGHTHVYQNYKDDNLLVLNAGSDYDNPKYIVLEV